MKRAAPDPSAALASVASMMHDGLALRLLLGHLPPGATIADARRLRERILQRGRRPSRLLDEALGIDRA
ncbi:MAG TPA: hypothetical protein VFD92_15085 [Candidatus Binatia bacterium]|nr:hypothetical protein [Candidatus Binatia bacterium]